MRPGLKAIEDLYGKNESKKPVYNPTFKQEIIKKNIDGSLGRTEVGW